MKRKLIRLLALAGALALLPLSALADIVWTDLSTPGQQQLKAYIDLVNQNQSQQNRGWVNSLFECYPTFAVLGMTTLDMAEMPEGVELSFTLNQDSLDTLQLRVNDPTRFAALAASCIQAAAPGAMTLDDALAEPTARAEQAIAAPSNSFEDVVDDLNGESPRVYYAYYPNQYRDGVNWLQMTLIFPMPGAADSTVVTATTPEPSASTEEYDGYDYDGGTHLEIFLTPTPEPDSPAGEQ